MATVEDRVLLRVEEHLKAKGQLSAQEVIDIIDSFGYKEEWLMCIGDKKGKYLEDAIKESKAKIVVECGTFIGYSSTRIARLLPEGGKVYTIDPDERRMKIAKRIHEIAGLSNKIICLNGKEIVRKDTDRLLRNLRSSDPFYQRLC